MPKQKVVIDPVTRIEGHLRITCAVENGKVVDAWNTCTMFRGFEIFMKDRNPFDCWHFAMRICGVCPTPHGVVAATAAERAMGVGNVPDNARLVRNMLQASMIGYDHILWFYQLNAFDYVNVPDAINAKTNDPELIAIQNQLKAIATSGQVDIISNQWWSSPAYLLTPEQNLILTSHYLQAIQVQQFANQAAAVLAGKFPMIMTLAAGGVTNLPSIEAIIYYRDMMSQVKDFVDAVLWNDMLAVAAVYKNLATFGQGVGNFLSWGILDAKSQAMQDRVFPSGAIFKGALTNITQPDPAKIQMFTKNSWFPDDLGAGKPPLDTGQEPQDFTQLPPITGPAFPSGKYDWTQAARYPDPSGNPVPMEVGPLAEVIIAYVKGEPLVKKYVDEVLAAIGAPGKPEVLVSNLGRVAARVIKARVNTDTALGWSDELLANVKAGDTTCWIDPPNRNGSGEGFGASDAPRGALSHYCRMENGKTTAWAAVPPSTWNLSPRDDKGVRGPVEQALIGTPVADVTAPIEIVRTVHTFDP